MKQKSVHFLNNGDVTKYLNVLGNTYWSNFENNPDFCHMTTIK